VPYCAAFCDEGHDTEHKMCVLSFPLLLLPETFFILRKREQDIASSVYGCLCDVSVIIVIIIIIIITRL